jgi:hypothetical protein
VYVDDLLILGPRKDSIDVIKKALNTRFQMTDLGPCRYYLGMTIDRDRPQRRLCLGQKGYITKFVEQFGIHSDRPTAVPISTKDAAPPKIPEGYQAASDLLAKYQSAVGSLMYAMLGTRPDIAFAVSLVSRFGSNPLPEHWKIVESLLRYLRSTVNLQLVFEGPLKPLVGYTDADYAGDPNTRRSTSGFLFNVGSGAISWQSKRQAVVALSSCESEYIGQSQATKESIWLRALFSELQHRQVQATVIYCDNQGAMALARNPEHHNRSKHIDVAHHFQRERVADGTVDLQYTPTETQVADGLTKALCKDKFVAFRMALGVK